MILIFGNNCCSFDTRVVFPEFVALCGKKIMHKQNVTETKEYRDSNFIIFLVLEITRVNVSMINFIPTNYLFKHQISPVNRCEERINTI